MPEPSQPDPPTVIAATPASTADDGGKKPHDLGILFVHGIGQQRPGETLFSTAGPLLEWLARHEVKLEFGSTILRPDVADQSAFSELALRFATTPGVVGHPATQSGAQSTNADAEPTQSNCRLLLAESCWADSFEAPSSAEFSRWLYGAGTSLLVIQLSEWLIEGQFRLVDLVNRPLNFLGLRGGFKQPNATEDFFRSVAVGIAGMALGAAFQALILVVALLAQIRVLRVGEGANALLRWLASILGDAEVFCQGILGREAIQTKVRDDLARLRAKCAKTVLAAHSQGAAVALGMLRTHESRPDTLITYGSGWRKLHQIRDLDQNSSIKQVSTFIFPLVLALLASAEFKDYALTVLLFFAMIFFAIYLGGVSDAEAWETEIRLAEEIDQLLRIDQDAATSRMHWLDCIATMDPVPAGMLLRWQLRADRQVSGRSISWKSLGSRFRTCFVVNQENPLVDHTSYWQSPDFLRLFVAAVAGHSRPICPDGALVERSWAFSGRRWRCLLRNGCHLAIYAMAANLYWRSSDEVKNFLPLFGPWVTKGLKSLFDGLQVYTPAIAWALGALAMLGFAFCWTRLICGPVWDLWDRHRVRSDRLSQLFECLLALAYFLTIAVPVYLLQTGAQAGRLEVVAQRA